VALENFYTWTVSDTDYTSVPSEHTVLVENRPTYHGGFGGIYKGWPYYTFKDYVLEFDFSLFSYDENSAVFLFDISGRDNPSGYYNSFGCTLRFISGQMRFKLQWYGTQYPSGVYSEFNIPLTNYLYFRIVKSDDYFYLYAYEDAGRTDLLGSTYVFHWVISNYDEHQIRFAGNNVDGLVYPYKYLTFEIENFNIVSTSSSSSFSSSSSSRSSSSSSSYSIDPVAVINDIGVKDGSYSSSSSSTILCQLVGTDDDWTAEVVSGNPAASWNETYQRWDSVALYGVYQYIGLDSITEIVGLEWLGYNVISSSYWTFNYGSYSAINQRIEPGYLGYAWYAALDKQVSWSPGYSPDVVQITITFPGSSGVVEIWGAGISGTQYTTPTSGVPFEINMSGAALDTLSFYCETVNFYITGITFAEGTLSGWPVGYTPNELKFTPTLVGGSDGIFDLVLVTSDTNTYILNQSNVPFTSGVEVSLDLNLFYDPRYISNVTIYIDNPTSNFYIEDLQFCGSASSSSSSYSSSSRSSSSSSSSNGAILDFEELIPATILPIQDNGPILSPAAGNVNYKGNTMRFLNIYDEYLYYQEYKDGQWSPQEKVYDAITDSIRDSRPMYLHYTGPFLADFDNRPAVVHVYNERKTTMHTVNIFDFNYKDSGGTWQRERISDDLGLDYSFTFIPTGATGSFGSPSIVAVSPDGVYYATAWGSTYPYFSIHKRSGSTYTKLTVSAPDVMPTGSLYITCMEFSPDGTYLACGMSSTPYIYLYKRTGDTFIKQSNPGNLPASTATCINWSSDSAFLCVTHNTSPKFTVYSRSGDTFTKTSNPGTLPSGTPNIGLFSPDTNYLVISQTSSPYVYCYSRSGTTFTLQSSLSGLSGYPYSMSWGADSSYIMFMRNYSSFDENFALYTNSGGVLSASATPYSTLFDVKPRVANERYPGFIKFTEDGSRLIIGFGGAPGLVIYNVSAGPLFTYNSSNTFDFYTGPSSKNNFAISPDSQYIITIASSNVITIDKSGSNYVQANKIGVLSKSDLASYNAVNNGPILMKQAPNGDFHILVQDSPRFIHLVRDYGTGNWSYSFVTPTYEIPFWEYGPGSYGEKTTGVMDSNGYIHFVYQRYYYNMPTTGSSYTKNYKLMYATNRTGSWVSSEIYHFEQGQYDTIQYWFPAIDVDVDGTVYVLGTAWPSGSSVVGKMCKLEVGGSWVVNTISSWNSSWYGFKGAVFDYFYAFEDDKFFAFDKTTLELAHSYMLSEIQTDPYTTGTMMSEGEDGRIISWKNLDGSDIRIRTLYPNPYYYEKLYVAEFSNSSSSRSSSSRSSSSSSSSSLASQTNLWTHDLTSFTGLNNLVEIIKDPTTTALHAMASTSSSSGVWYKKASPSSGVWTLEGNACTFSSVTDFHKNKMLVRSTDNMRFFFYSSSNYMYYKTRADGGATWSSNTTVVPYVDAYHYPRCFDVVEDSSGYLHILYVEEVSSNIGSIFPYTHNLIHRHNTSGSWVSETIWTTTESYSGNSGAPQCLVAQILPGNVIHLFFVLYNHGVVYSTGFTGSWTTSWFIEDRNYVNYSTVRLVKDTNNNLHMACVYRNGHNYSVSSVDYAYYNGVTWTKQEDSFRNVAVPGYFTLITDINNRPHLIFLNSNKSNKMEEWMRDDNGYWGYVTTEEYTFSTSFEFTGVYSDGYLNTFGRSSTGVPIYSQRYIESEGT
jgi:hypothetical protein